MADKLDFKIKSISGRIPSYETTGSAGMDLQAFLKEPVVLEPGKRMLVPTGLYMELPPGYEGQIRARSGLSLKHGIAMANGVGTIDSDYRGELGVILINLGELPFEIRDGDRIAQLVISSHERIEWKLDQLSPTERGTGGFGHTGI